MADDIAKLGFSVETKELVKAQKELDKVAKSGKSVEKSGGLISRSMTSAASDTKKSGGLISQSMTSAASSTAKSGGLISKTTISVAKGFGALGLAAGGLVASFVGLTSSAREYQTALAEVSTLVDTTTFDMDKLSETAMEQAGEFGAMPTDLVKAYYQAISAGASTAAQATDAVTAANKLAVGGVTDVKTGVDGLTSVMNAYAGKAGSFTDISDAMFIAMKAGKTTISELSSSIGDLAPIASQAGASFDEVMAATAALTKGGVSTSTSMGGLRAILASVIKPSSEAKKMADELGLQFDAAALKTKGLAGFLQDLQEKTGGNTEKMAMLFGGVEALTPALALTGGASKDFSATLADMANKSGATDEAFSKMSNTADFQAGRIKAGLSAAWIDLTGTLAEKATPALKAIADSMDGLNQWVDDLGVTVDILIEKWRVLAPFFAMAWDDVKLAFGSAYTDISATVEMIAGGVSIVLDEIKLTYAAFMSAFGLTTEESLSSVSFTFSDVWGAIKETISGTWNLISGIIKTGFELITGIMTTGLRVLRGDWSGAWEALKETVLNFWANLKDIFGGMAKEFSEFGKNIADGLTNGIKNAASGAANAAKNMASSVADSVTDFFDIRSPSRLMGEYGEYVAEGLAVGIEDGTHYTVDATSQMNNKVTDEMRRLVKSAEEIGSDLSAAIAGNMLGGDFKSVGNTLAGTFKNDILNPILDDAINPFATAVTKAMSGVGDSIDGIVKGTGSSGGLFSSIGSGLSSIMSASTGILGGASLGAGIGSLLGGDSSMGTIGGAIGSLFGPIGSAVGGFLGSMASSIFGGQKSVKGTGSALQYSSGEFSGRTYTDMKKSGGWFSSSKYWTDFKDFSDESSNAISEYFDTVEESIKAQAEFFGVTSAENILNSFDSGLIKLSGKGDMSDQIEEWATGITEELYESVFKTKFSALAQTGEDLATTISRLIIEIDTVKQGFDGLDIALEYTGTKAAEVADGLTQAAGSLDNLQSLMTTYYDTVYTDALKSEIAYNDAVDALREFNDYLGLTGERSIDTAEELKAYVEALDVSTAAGQEAFVVAMSLAQSIADFSGTAQEAADALEAAAEDIENAFVEVITEVDSFTSAIASLARTLYGTAEESYALELARYTALQSGAESLLQTAAGFSDSVSSDSSNLSSAQIEYNKQLQAVQSGDTGAIDELQAAATRLKSALDSSYAGGSQAISGTQQIEKQLTTLAENMLGQAGSEPIAPEDVQADLLTENDRALLADSLLTSMQTLALAEDTTVAALMAQNGVYITNLASDLGINLDSLRDVTKTLSNDEVSAIDTLAGRIGSTNVELMQALGVNAETIGQTVYDSLSTLPNVPDDIRAGLAPYLAAIENSNDYTTLETTLSATRAYISTLPADIKTKLNAQLNSIVGESAGTTNAVELLASLTKSEFSSLAQTFGINSRTIEAAVNGSSDEFIKGLSNLSNTFNVDLIELAERLDVNAETVSGAISYSLKTLPDLPDDIKSGLSPYLSAIENATDTAELESILSLTRSYINTLPSDIKSSLLAQFNSIVGSTNTVKNSVDAMKNLNAAQLSNVAKAYGINSASIASAVNGSGKQLLNGLITLSNDIGSDLLTVSNKLGITTSTLKTAIVSSLESLPDLSDDIKSNLAPYLSAIESSNSTDELESILSVTRNYINSLPSNIKTQLLAQFNSIVGATSGVKNAVSSLQSLNTTQLNKVAESYGINSKTIANAVSGSGSSLLNSIVSMSNDLGSDLLTVSNKLGINSNVIKSAITSSLSTLPNLSDDIKADLAPYLTAIENSNDYSTLETTLAATRAYIATLPDDIQSELNAQLNSIVGKTAGTTTAVNLLSNMTKAELSELADVFGVNSRSLENSIDNLNNDFIDSLSDMSKAFNTDIYTIAKGLEINSAIVSNAISNSLDSLPSLSQDIKNGLSPYLTSIEKANNTDSLGTAIGLTNAYIATLPDDIQSELNAQLNSVIGSNVSIKSGVDLLKSVTSSELKSLSKSFGIDIDTINASINAGDKSVVANLSKMSSALNTDIATLGSKLGVNTSVIAKAIVDNLIDVPSEINSGLAPYLSAIESSNNTEDLQTAIGLTSAYINSLPTGIKESLADKLNSIYTANNAGVSATNSSTQAIMSNSKLTIDQLKILANSFDLSVDDLNSSNQTTARNSVNALNALAKSVDLSSVYVASQLGATLTQIRTAINTQIGSITGVTDEVKNSLSAYTKSISDSMSVEELESALVSMSGYINSLPTGIKSVLTPQINWLAAVGESTVSSINNVNSTIKDKITSLADSIGFDFASLAASNKKLSDLQLQQLIQVASLAGTSPSNTADLLGIQISTFGQSLADSINARTAGISSSLIDGLEPYLDALAGATTVSASDQAYTALSGYLATLPADIRNQLSGHLTAINTSVIDGTESTRTEVFDSSWNYLRQIRTAVEMIWRNSRFWNQSQGVQAYAKGSDYIQGDQLANIHNGEAIFTASQSAGLRRDVMAIMAERKSATAPQSIIINQNGNSEKSERLMGEIVKELKETKNELKELKQNQQAASYQLSKNTKDTYKLLDRWEGGGIPKERA